MSEQKPEIRYDCGCRTDGISMRELCSEHARRLNTGQWPQVAVSGEHVVLQGESGWVWHQGCQCLGCRYGSRLAGLGQSQRS